jgi:hypothetical protein
MLLIFSGCSRNCQKSPELKCCLTIYMEGVSEEVVELKAKPKRQLSEKQLAQLAKAREKANAVRKKNAELKRKEKQVQQMKRQQQ